MPADIQDFLHSLALAIPPSLAHIAAQAEAFFEDRLGNGTGVIGKVGHENVIAIQDKYLSAAHALQDTPAIARVACVQDGEDLNVIYYFCRTVVPGTIAPSEGKLVAYHMPHGRLAELTPGSTEDIKTPSGEREFKVLSTALFRPQKEAGAWNAVAVEASIIGASGATSSLLSLLRKATKLSDLSVLFGELDEEAAEQARAEQRRHARQARAIDSIALRDRPTLNSYQGAVFRLPLRKHLALFGPPGSGKTTTLIHRCSHKRLWEALDQDEQNSLESAGLRQLHARSQSWVMFSPSDLLSEYLKEAFARENVPARQNNLRVWAERRTELARDILNIFKGQPGGRFTPFGGTLLQDERSASQRALFDDFAKYSNDAIAMQATGLAQAVASEIHEHVEDHLRERLARVLANVTGDDWWRPLVRDFALLNEIHGLISKALMRDVKDTLGGLLFSDPDLVTDVQTAWAALHTDEESPDSIDEDEEDPEEPLVAATLPTTQTATRAQAGQMVIEAIRLRARIAAGTAVAPKKKAMARLLAQFGQRLGSTAALKPIGLLAQFVQRLGRLTRAPKNAIFGLRAQYAGFRKERATQGAWYVVTAAETQNARRITEPEVDVLVLAMLQAAGRIYNRLGRRELPEWLEPFDRTYYLQVFVDEATDFGAVQLACMAELTHPKLRSFFACGDFQQRITTGGIRDLNDLDWLGQTVGTTLDVQEINIGYRQNPSLSRLAKLLAPDAVIGTERDKAASHDAGPILFEHATDAALGPWMVTRVREIKRALGKLPSIAVFVDGDERIQPVVSALKAHFDEYAIPVVGCPGGRIVGKNQEVRVFDVRHVKGLEFEAVFMLDVDRLESRSADLASRLLFVGVTRAASYLAVCVSGRLPANLEHLRPAFTGTNWA